MAALESDFEHTTPNSQAALLKHLESAAGINIAASPQVATSIALVDGKPHIFLMNFAGLHGGVNPVQTLQTGIRVTVSPEIKGPAFLLPFLGEVQQLEGVRLDGGISYTLPPISKVRLSGTSLLQNTLPVLKRIDKCDARRVPLG